MNPDWLQYVYAGTDQLFQLRLGPEIFLAARDFCPVFGGQNSTAKESSMDAAPEDYEPGALRDSIEFHLRVHTLIVSASGSDERTYAAYVELGHRVVAWGHPMGYSKPPQPFLRPALFAVRGASV